MALFCIAYEGLGVILCTLQRAAKQPQTPYYWQAMPGLIRMLLCLLFLKIVFMNRRARNYTDASVDEHKSVIEVCTLGGYHCWWFYHYLAFILRYYLNQISALT